MAQIWFQILRTLSTWHLAEGVRGGQDWQPTAHPSGKGRGWVSGVKASLGCDGPFPAMGQTRMPPDYQAWGLWDTWGSFICHTCPVTPLTGPTAYPSGLPSIRSLSPAFCLGLNLESQSPFLPVCSL